METVSRWAAHGGEQLVCLKHAVLGDGHRR